MEAFSLWVEMKLVVLNGMTPEKVESTEEV